MAIHQTDHRMSVPHHHPRDRERERDLVHLREKEEYRMQREKEIQQQEHRLAQQREKEAQHAEHRLSIQQREKDIQHTDHRLTVHQQREKEIHQQMAAAVAQREKEHQEHRLAVQQRERDLHLQQQQQQQQQLQQHIQQQQRIEAERRHMAQLYRDQQQQQLDRDTGRLISSGFSQSSRLQQPQQSQQQQQQQQQASSRQSQGSNQQQNETASTLTAASLIDAIITHQINQSVENTGGNSQPQRPGDRSSFPGTFKFLTDIIHEPCDSLGVHAHRCVLHDRRNFRDSIERLLQNPMEWHIVLLAKEIVVIMEQGARVAMEAETNRSLSGNMLITLFLRTMDLHILRIGHIAGKSTELLDWR